MSGWSLADGEALAAAHPDTFLVAPYETRARLRAGDYAKALFEFASRELPNGLASERMWLVVLTNDSGHYVGRLVNEPYALPDDPALHYLAEIAFEARHIINWKEADDRSRAFVADPSSEQA